MFLPLADSQTLQSTSAYKVNVRNAPTVSNRCSFCYKNVLPVPTLPNIPSIGIDKIAVDIPLVTGVADPKFFLSSIKNTMLGRWGNKAVTIHAPTGAKIQWRLLLTSWSIRMEFNPARMIDPDGYSLASPKAIAGLIRSLIEEYFLESEDSLPFFLVNENGEVNIEVWPSDWTSRIRIGRLDISMDFQIDKKWFHEGLLLSHQAKYSKGASLVNNKGVTNTWSSVYTHRDGFPKFYNKSNELKRRGIQAPPGIHRFEYRIEKKSLRRLHIHNLSDINEIKFEAALRHGWEYSNLSEPIYDPEDWIQRINESGGAIPNPSELVGFLLLSEKGIETGLSKSEKKELTRIALELQINPKKPLGRQPNGAYRLDIETQELVRLS